MSESLTSPYPGLRPFRVDEDYLFFGREEQTAELVRLLREHRFLAVVGRSGSGKSSLVRAGLLPEIQGGMMQHAGSAWEMAVMRPGGNPVRNLAKCLIEADLYDAEDEESVPRLLATLNHSALGLVEAFHQSDVEDGNLLIVVDQFEELFRFEQHDAQARDAAHAFVELLLEASATSDVPIYVILTMRSDYLGDCAHVPGLAEAVNRGEYLIPRLGRNQLRAAMEGPAKVEGGEISYRLLQHLLNELGDEEDQLPVLQHALMRTWSFWQDDHDEGEAVDLRHYESSGGMKRAISNHADEIFDSLPDDHHRAVAERLFRSLTVKGGDNRGVRRPTKLGQLAAIANEDDGIVKAVIEAYRKSGVTFLMPGEERDLDGDTVIDLSHESLMRVWQRLRRWVDDEAQSARIYERLVDTAKLHAEGKAGLYHNPDLDIALAWRDDEKPNQAWAEQYDGGFDQGMAFLNQSAEEAQRVEREAEEARERELAQAKALAESRARTTVLLKRFAAVIGAVCLLAVGLAMWATKESHRASKAEAEARAAAAKAENAASVAENAQGRHWLANAESLEKGVDGFAARLKAARALGFEGFGREHLTDTQKEEIPVLLKEDQAGWEEALELAKADTNALLLWQHGTLPQHTNEINSAVLSPDGKLVASCAEGEMIVHIWDGTSGDSITTLDVSMMENPEVLAFSPKGDFLVAAGNDELVFWKVAGGRFRLTQAEPFVLGQSSQPMQQGDSGNDATPPDLRSLAFSPNGRSLALGDGRGRLYVWRDWRSFQSPPSIPTHEGLHDSGRIRNLAFQPGPNEEWLASVGGEDGAILLFDARKDYELAATLLVPKGVRDDAKLWSLSFSSDGRLLVAGGAYFPVTVWDVNERELKATLLREEWDTLNQVIREDGNFGFACRSVDFSSDGRKLAIGWWQNGWRPDPRRYKSTVSVFDCEDGMPVVSKRHDFFSGTSGVVGVAFVPESERLLMTVGQSNRLQLWDLEQDKPVGENASVSSGPIEAIRFSPDGTHFATGDHNGFVKIWNAHKGQLLHDIDAHIKVVDSVLFSPDGRKLYSLSHEDGTLAAWDVETGTLLKRITTRQTSFELELSPDQEFLVLLGWGTQLRFHDRDSLEEQSYAGVGSGHRFKFSPGGKRLVVYKKTNNLSDVRFGLLEFHDEWLPVDRGLYLNHLRSKPLHTSVEFGPDGLTLALPYKDGEVQVLNREADGRWTEGQSLQMPEGGKNPLLAFDSSGSRLFTGDSNGTVAIWNTDDGKLMQIIRGPSAITSLALSPDGRILVTGSERGILQMWSVAKGDESFSVELEGIGSQDNSRHWFIRGSYSQALARSRRLLFTAGEGEDSTVVKAWKLVGGKLTPAFDLAGHEHPPALFALSQDERFLISTTWNPQGRIIRWDLETQTHRVLARGGGYANMTLSPDGKTLAARLWVSNEHDPSNPLQVIDDWPIDFFDTTLEDQSEPIAHSIPLHSNSLGLSFTPESKQLIVNSALEDSPMVILNYDPETRATTLASELSLRGKGTGLTMSSNGRFFSACSTNGNEAGLWDAQTFQRLGRIPSTSQWNASTALSPDDSLVAYGGGGGFRTKVYRTGSSGGLVAQFEDKRRGLVAYVSDVDFDSDGRTLILSRNDGSIVVWRLALGETLIEPWKYLDVVELGEATGSLDWRAHKKLTQSAKPYVFVPVEERYLPFLHDLDSHNERTEALFSYYLENEHFHAAYAALQTLDPERADSLWKTLSIRAADVLVRSRAAGKAREVGPLRHLAQRLFENHPPELDVRLQLLLERADWKSLTKLLSGEFQSFSREDRMKVWESLVESLNLYAEGLIPRLGTLDNNDPAIPPRELLLAAALFEAEKAFATAWDENKWSAAQVLDNLPATALLLEALKVNSQTTLLPAGSEWRYFASLENPDEDWNQIGYTHEANWESGAAPLGYGGLTIHEYGTQLKSRFRSRNSGQLAYYFRKDIVVHKEVESTSPISANLLYDDGLILYLDGKEILRLNMPSGEITPETTALDIINAEKEQWVQVPLPNLSLEPGPHLLAAEIHQQRDRSSDILFDLELASPPKEQWKTPETLSDGLAFLTSIDRSGELFPWVSCFDGMIGSPGHVAFSIHILDFIGETEAALKQVDKRLTQEDERSYWLGWKLERFRLLGRSDAEQSALRSKIATIPPRAPDLSPKLLDLTEFYTGNLSSVSTPKSTGYSLPELPSTFNPLKGVFFDLRGVVQLDSGDIPVGAGNRSEPQTVSEISGRPIPERVNGISVNQRSEALHFLMGCTYGRAALGSEAAHFVIHYEDGSEEKASILYPNDIADWVGGNNVPLPEERIGWQIDRGEQGERILSEVVWQNPHPDKTITSIDFVSGLKACAPFLVGITLE